MAPLPDRTTVDDLELRRWDAATAGALHDAITANVDHLRPRMPWIGLEPQTIEQRRTLVDGWETAWRDGGDVIMGVWRDGAVVGSAGLHRRVGPAGLEIGYWVVAAAQGQGIATRASAALVDLAFTVDGIDFVDLGHDRTNRASRRVPEKLGFTYRGEVTITDPALLAPADGPHQGRWRMTRADWPGGVAPARQP